MVKNELERSFRRQGEMTHRDVGDNMKEDVQNKPVNCMMESEIELVPHSSCRRLQIYFLCEAIA
jgi:hypothetical protein